jgi:hypothetical protein
MGEREDEDATIFVDFGGLKYSCVDINMASAVRNQPHRRVVPTGDEAPRQDN